MNRTTAKRLVLFCNLSLFLASIILGFSFVAQKSGMDYMGPLTFNTLRFLIGSLSLLFVYFIGDKFKMFVGERNSDRDLIRGGSLAGLVLFVAFSINQYCMQFAEAGKAGFVTALYIIFVPIIYVFMKHRLGVNVQIGIGLALIGLYLLCAKGTMGFDAWDIGILVSAFFFALHIIIVSFYTKKVSAIKLSCLQFGVAGLLSLPCMFLFETPVLASIVAGIKQILFIGVIVTAGAYTLQVFGQKAAKPVHATMILSLESVFAVVGGMIFLGESLNFREFLGCVLMIAAIIISQLNVKFSPHQK